MPAGDAGLERQTLSERVRERLTEAHMRIDDVLSDRDASPFHEILDNTQQLTDLIDRLQAQLAAQQAVVDAARAGLEYIAHLTWTLPEAYAAANQMQERAFYDLGRMDKAQAAQPEGEGW